MARRIVSYAPPVFGPTLQPPLGVPPGVIPGIAGPHAAFTHPIPATMQLGAADDRRLRRWHRREARLLRRLARKRPGSRSAQRLQARIDKIRAKIRQLSGEGLMLPTTPAPTPIAPLVAPAPPPTLPAWALPAAVVVVGVAVAVAASRRK